VPRSCGRNDTDETHAKPRVGGGARSPPQALVKSTKASITRVGFFINSPFHLREATPGLDESAYCADMARVSDGDGTDQQITVEAPAGVEVAFVVERFHHVASLAVLPKAKRVGGQSDSVQHTHGEGLPR
jgi:hypothetical protein